MFAPGSMIKNRKAKNIEDGIKQVNKIYLKCSFIITRIHADRKFDMLSAEMADLGIYLNFAWG